MFDMLHISICFMLTLSLVFVLEVHDDSSHLLHICATAAAYGRNLCTL
jgi:hypothetical protein